MLASEKHVVYHSVRAQEVIMDSETQNSCDHTATTMLV
jgi:hypothetical protein